MVTTLTLVSFGFEVSLQIEQAVIDRAERDITAGYIVPLLGNNFDTSNAIIVNAINTLTFCLLLRRTIKKTRYGADKKNNPYGMKAQYDEVGEEIINSVSVCLHQLSRLPGADLEAPIIDVCGIFYKNYYFYN